MGLIIYFDWPRVQSTLLCFMVKSIQKKEHTRKQTNTIVVRLKKKKKCPHLTNTRQTLQNCKRKCPCNSIGSNKTTSIFFSLHFFKSWDVCWLQLLKTVCSLTVTMNVHVHKEITIRTHTHTYIHIFFL